MIWFYAARYLGTGASREDIEDAVVDFFDKLEEARRHYTPGGPAFATFLIHVCYKNHCVRKGEMIRRSLAMEFIDADRVCLEIRDDSSDADPERLAQGRSLLSAISDFVATGALTQKERTAFVLRYGDGLSYEEIAAAMNAPVGSVKGWLHRGTKSVRQYLLERGWS